MTPEAHQLILDLCHEAGDEGTDEQILVNFTINHPDLLDDTMATEGEAHDDALVEAAAHGDVAALLDLRMILGLPPIR